MLSSCRFREPEPSEAVYRAAVAEAAPRPGIQRSEPKPRQAAPAEARPEGGSKDGRKELVDVAARHALCTAHQGTVGAVGPAVRALTDTADAAKAAVDDDSGVLLEAAPSGYRVCLILLRAAAGSTRISGGRTARLWHVGEYGKLRARFADLTAWLSTQGVVPAAGARVRMTLFVDPESAKREADLLSSIELLVLPAP